MEARVACNNYNVVGCSVLDAIYNTNNVNLFVKNISQKESFKNQLRYTLKACMLGY